jgi:hypothetical protein
MSPESGVLTRIAQTDGWSAADWISVVEQFAELQVPPDRVVDLLMVILEQEVN